VAGLSPFFSPGVGVLHRELVALNEEKVLLQMINLISFRVKTIQIIYARKYI
jgi:hypothetical protein